MEKIKNYEANLLRFLLENRLDQITNTFYQTLQCPFNVTDEYYHLMVQFPMQKIGDLIWDSYVQNGKLTTEIIKLLNEMKLIERGYKETKPYIINETPLGSYPRVTSTIQIDRKVYGYLTVYFIDEKISKEDLEIIDTTSRVLALYYNRNSNSFSSVQNIYELMMNQLFLDLINTESELTQWQSILPVAIKSNCIIFCAQSQKSTSDIPLLQKLCNEIETHFQYPKCTVFRGKLYLLFDDIHNPSINHLLIQIISHIERYSLEIGASSEFSNLLFTRTFRKQAEIAASLSKAGMTVYFPKIALQAIEQQIKEKQIYYHPALSTLKEFDQKNNTEYYRTLVSYLVHFGKQNEIEMDLKVHRNTVHNRLSAIEKITECCLNDSYTFTHLYLTYIMIDCA